MTTRARLLVLALLLLAAALPALALDIPPAPTQWVTDAANILPQTDEDLLNAKLRQFEQDSGAQFLIYTFPSLENEALEDFTIRAVERWKVGQKKYDNGLVLFVFVAEKKIRVEVGYGLEGTMTDAFSSRVIREQIAPAFQQNDYSRGLNAAADAIITKIKTGEEAVPPLNADRPQSQSPQNARGSDLSLVEVIIILFVIFFVVLPMLRRGGCSGCMLPFFFGGGPGITFGGGGGGFGGGSFGGGGGFSGGGGSFGGGGASGGW